MRHEVLAVEPASREEMLAYLAYNRRLVDVSLAIAHEIGGGESTLGPWRGPTSTLLSMFHGNACHLVGHVTEVVPQAAEPTGQSRAKPARSREPA